MRRQDHRADATDEILDLIHACLDCHGRRLESLTWQVYCQPVLTDSKTFEYDTFLKTTAGKP